METILQAIRPDIRAMQAYHVADARGLLKMDAMENPWGLPPELQQALGERLAAAPLHRYPDSARLDALKSALRAHAGATAEQGIVLGNGSDEIIALLTLACARPGACVLAPVPSFVMYAASALLHGVEFVGVDLTADFTLDVAAMQQAIAARRPAIVWLAWPNNPTATLWAEQDMQDIIHAAAQAGSLVVVDEAYQPFAGSSWQAHILARPQQHRHVLLMRTLSKFGLAGVRLGYLLGAAALVQEIDKVRPPYNISTLNCEAARFALEHADVYAIQAQDICRERQSLLQALAQIPFVQRVWPSQANMILLRVPDAARSAARMQALGVLVKNVSAMHPLLQNCLRLTVGKPEENTRMLDALRQSP